MLFRTRRAAENYTMKWSPTSTVAIGSRRLAPFLGPGSSGASRAGPGRGARSGASPVAAGGAPRGLLPQGRLPGMLALAAVVALAPGWPSPAQARSHSAGRKGVAAAAARVLPAVVSITIRRVEAGPSGNAVSRSGMGSGFIVDRRGYIVTNNHVVGGAERIQVILPDERVFRATLVAGDPVTDLAVLKVEGESLPVAPLGHSRELAVGETVAAIGSPLWIEGGPTVTVGIVSGLGRFLEEPGLPTLHNLIQTDAAINPGNSGGPLVNLAGQVVGINTAIVPSAHGIGFAIAIDSAKPVLRRLMANDRVARPSLGLTAVSVTPQLAFVNDLEVRRGILVTQVEPGGPAEAAGIRRGDVITTVRGRAVRDLHQFHESLWGQGAEASVEVTVYRDGERLTMRPVPRQEP